MKLAALSLLFVASTAMAGFADNTPITKADVACHEQAVLIGQTYDFYRSGASEETALKRQTASSTPKSTMDWMRNMIRKIYSDPRSMYVDEATTTELYERKCLKNPNAYVRDKRLLE